MQRDIYTCVLVSTQKEEEKDLVEVCRRLMVNLQDGNCTLTWQHRNGKIHFDCVEINGKGEALSHLNEMRGKLILLSANKHTCMCLTVKTNLATQYYEEITKV